jgi:hypothetical protein
MKVMCISNKGWERLPLTIDKIYEVVSQEYVPFSPHRYDDDSGLFYLITCDDYELRHISADNFRELNLDEKRELKLHHLGL